MNIDGKYVNDPTDIAKLFNDFFIDHIIPNPNSKTCNDTMTSMKFSQSLFMKPTTSFDINIIIKSLKNSNSTGYDEISTRVIKETSEYISPILSHIINLSIVSGIFPDKLKITIIKPLFKKKDKHDINCYRPIALIPVFSKIFEKVINNSVYNYFESYKIFTDEQVGFRKNKSINLAIYRFLRTVISSLDCKNLVFALYMDLSKAFDYVDHQILLHKLETYGIRGNVLKLIESYLSNRVQATDITRICYKAKQEIVYRSEYRVTKYGVPQGSVLGPLLFIIYINDLPKAVSDQMILFADDSTVLFTDTCRSRLECTINTTLEIIIKWLECNNLLINLDKTHIMTFSNNYNLNNQSDININYSGMNISKVDMTKFLGLNLDENLNWKIHVSNLCKKLNQFSYAMYMLRKVVNEAAVITAYHGFAESVLRYGIIFWGNSTLKEQIFVSQKKCVRAICKLQKTDSCKPYFSELKILTLPCLYIFELSVFVKSNMDLFINFRCRRNNNKLRLPRNQTALFNKSVLCMAIRVYNHLPISLKETSSPAVFKVRLKKLLLKKAYYSTQDYLNDKNIDI